MQYSKEELNEAYKKLPEELKDVFLNTDITDSINDIGKKYNLHIDRIGELDSEVGLVLLGLTHPTDFVSSLTKRLGIDRIIASQIASDINDQIFLKVRETLKDIQEKRSKEEKPPAEETEKVESEHPTRDALLASIENPEILTKKPAPTKPEIPLVAIRNPYEPAKPELGKDVPVVAPAPRSIPVPVEDTTDDILTQKMSGQFSLPKVETKMEMPQPSSGKKTDPYREPTV